MSMSTSRPSTFSLSSLSTQRFGRARSTGRWLFWAPVLAVGGLLYWTVALGLGGLSLVAVTALSAGGAETIEVPASGASDTLVVTTEQADDDVRPGDPITVHLQESVEPEDVNDNPGAGSATGTDDPAALASPAPGPTAF